MSGLKQGAGRRQLLAALTDHGPASRVELARRTGLSSSAVSVLTQHLIADGLVVEDDGPAAAAPAAPDVSPVVRRPRGRPALRLRLRAPEGLVVGVDVGNSHVRVACARVGGPVLVERVALPAATDLLEATLDLVDRLVREVVAGAEEPLDAVRLVTLGLPAPLEHATGAVTHNNILPAWVGRRPGEELSARLGVEVVVENDANLGAVAERGATGDDALVYVKLSTGIGAGLVLGGGVFRGVGGTAGEVGHVQVDPAGVLCRCGLRGCLETVASVPRMVAALAPVTRDDLAPADLDRLLGDGHAGAVRVVTDAGRTIGQVLAGTVTVLNPGSVVVGGPWSALNALLAQEIGRAVQQWAQPTASGQVRVRASSWGERAEVTGALALATDLVTRREQGLLAGV